MKLSGVFEGFRAEMDAHTAKEARILFPAIRSLEGVGEPTPLGRNVAAPIQVMLTDHDQSGAALAKMRELTDGFVPSPTACNTHRAMLVALVELEADIHLHVHKVNNILFPRAIEASLAA